MITYPRDYNINTHSKKVVKCKCRSCGKGFTEHNRYPEFCHHCNSDKVHEVK